MNRRQFFASSAVLSLASCSRSVKARIGSRDNVEGMILGEVLATHLEAKLKARIERRLNLGPSPVLYQAIQNGDVEIYPEYSGVAYKSLFKVDEPMDSQMYYEKIAEQWRTKCGVEWMPPLGFENLHTAVVRADDPNFSSINTLSEAGIDKTGWKVGFVSSFAESPEGYPLLKAKYQMRERGAPRIEPLGQLYFSLAEKRIDILFTTSTDPRLGNKKFKTLVDDKKIFARSFCSYAVRSLLATDHPELIDSIKQLSGKISNEMIIKYNAEVEIQKRAIADVARDLYTELKIA